VLEPHLNPGADRPQSGFVQTGMEGVRAMTFAPLFTEFVFEHPDIDEVRDFNSLVVRIRDRNDLGVNVDFRRVLLYSKTDESYALDTVNALFKAKANGHWLYEIGESQVLDDFKERNPHIHPDWALKHYLIVTDNDIINVVAIESPTVSNRTENIRGWLRPGETRSD
jgi:hypothetical protein